ncbi:glycosyl hydrolase, partial [Aspergillus rambellii]
HNKDHILSNGHLNPIVDSSLQIPNSTTLERNRKMYSNPIIPGFNPDPSLIRVNNDFFLVTSTFEYVPGAPIYHSTDLIQWKLIGHALTRPSQLQIHTPEPGGGVWATTLRYHKGVFYILAASFERYRPQDDDRVWPRGFYVKTGNIWDSDSWSDPVYFDQVGFDPDIFWDDDDTAYLSTTYRKIHRTPGKPIKDFAIHISTVDLETGNATSTPRLIRESSSGVAEGSHIFKRGKYYYLFTAEGGTESGHCEWVNRSETGPFGPWELGPNNPLWRNGVNDEVQNTGHADLVTDVNGQWWAVLLGVRPVQRDGYWEESVFGRETFLVPLAWENDWPVLNGGGKITLHYGGPQLYQFQHPVEWRDDFASSTLQLGWYRKNTPVKKDYSLTTRPNYLRLHGNPYTLSIPTCPTLFLRKQTHRFCTWETSLSFSPTSPNTEAGTVLWLNYFTYSSIGIRLSPGAEPESNDSHSKKRIIRFRHVSGEAIDMDLSTVSNEVTLVIASGDEYKFGFREEEEEEGESFTSSSTSTSASNTSPGITWLGSISNKDMVEAPLPVGALFTGMMLGLYAFGDRESCLVPADFGHAEFRSNDYY